MRKIGLVFILLLPLLVPFGMVVYHASSKGDMWMLPVTGYDPRDLLRGQYIQFRYDIKQGESEMCALSDMCILCLNGTSKSPTFTIADAESAPRLCRSWVGVDDIQGQQRFYISESIASSADALMRTQADDIKAKVFIKDGRLSLESLVIHETSDIRDYLRDNKGRL